MTVQTVTFGTEQFQTFTAAASGTDYVSNWNVNASVTTAEAPLTGSFTNTTGRPINLYSLQLLWWANANPTTTVIQFQISTANTGGGGVQSGDTNANGADTTVAMNYGIDKATNVVYYGFQKQDSGNVRFSTYTSTGNDIYTNGSVGWADRRETAAIVVHSVPNAPGTPTFVSATATTITLSWTAPSDVGSAGGINGYRVAVKEYSLPNGTNNANWRIATLSSQASLGDSGSTATTATVTGLNPGTRYDFRVAGLNSVTDEFNTDYSTIAAHTGTRSAAPTDVMSTLSGIYNGTTWVAPTAYVFRDFPLTSGTTYTANSITSTVVITYPAGNTSPYVTGDIGTIVTGVTNIDTANVSMTINNTARTITYSKSVSNGSGSITGNVTSWGNANIRVYNNANTWVNWGYRP